MSKVVLVTGASSGFGQSIVHHLATQGHRVYGTSRRVADRQVGAVTEGNPHGSETAPPAAGAAHYPRMLPLDVTDDASVANCVARLLALEDRIDVLINNAGIGLCGAVEDTTIDEARWQMDTNFFGVVRMVRAVLPHMRAQGSGRIITISSLAGLAALPYQPYYSSSKFALEGLNEALRLELGGSGIDATTINPGDFRTGFTAARVFAESARKGVHGARLNGTVAIYERDESQGADPQQVAELAGRLVKARRVRVRYSVGRFDQRLGIQLKRWLPATVFERLMKVTYRLP